VATKVVAKSADVLSQIAATKSGSACGRFSPYKGGTAALTRLRLAVAVLTGKKGT
jgi:hypothetical protein